MPCLSALTSRPSLAPIPHHDIFVRIYLCTLVAISADEEKRRNNGHTNKPGFRSVRRLSAPVNLAAVSGSCWLLLALSLSLSLSLIHTYIYSSWWGV
uniref:Uncharacterized protein n=1 Tax=Zea mays TaxID=4577 RepID=C0PNL0_MAIZE|nr:unknown [Zea mays]